MEKNNFILFKTIIAIIVVIEAAICSTYFYFIPHQNLCKSVYPGAIYTFGTVIVCLLFARINSILNWVYYCCLMVATYYVVWIMTLYSTGLAFIVGIFTAGIGSLATFYLADKFITDISFNKRSVFIVGGLSFLVTDILLFSWRYDKPPIEFIFKLSDSNDSMYGEVILLWQLFVGLKFVLALRATNRQFSTQH